MKFLPYTLLVMLVCFLSKTITGGKKTINFEGLASERLDRYISQLKSENKDISYKFSNLKEYF